MFGRWRLLLRLLLLLLLRRDRRRCWIVPSGRHGQDRLGLGLRGVKATQLNQLDVPITVGVPLLLMISRMKGAALGVVRGAELTATWATREESLRSAIVAKRAAARAVRRQVLCSGEAVSSPPPQACQAPSESS